MAATIINVIYRAARSLGRAWKTPRLTATWSTWQWQTSWTARNRRLKPPLCCSRRPPARNAGSRKTSLAKPGSNTGKCSPMTTRTGRSLTDILSRQPLPWSLTTEAAQSSSPASRRSRPGSKLTGNDALSGGISASLCGRSPGRKILRQGSVSSHTYLKAPGNRCFFVMAALPLPYTQ